MEQTRAQAKVDELKKQYEMVDTHLAKSDVSEAKRDIEHHFDTLFNAILERKEALLKSLESSFALLKAEIIEEQKHLKSKLESATRVLEAGLTLLTTNQDAARAILKGIDLINHHQDFTLFTSLPDSLIHIINEHGLTSTQLLQCQQVTTLAGSSGGCINGVGSLAKFNGPRGVFNPDDKCLYVCDLYNNMIRKVTLTGEVSVYCKVSYPVTIAYNQQQKLFYVSSADNIHQISSKGAISLLNYKSFRATGITVNSKTNDLYVFENGSHAIRKITPGGVMSLLAGSNNSGHLDGTKEEAQFNNPLDLAFHEKEQALIVCDHANNCLRRITMDGNVTTLHKVPSPRCISLLTDDIALVSSSTNQIFKVQLSNVNKVEVFAGIEEKGNEDGPALGKSI